MDGGVLSSLSLVFGFIILVEGSKYDQKVGPYIAILEKMERCQDEGTRQFIYSTRLVSKGNGTYGYGGPFILGVPMDEHYALRMELYSWGNGGWKLFTNSTTRGCENNFKLFPGFMKYLTKGMGIKSLKCPIHKGNYTMTGWEEGSLIFEADPRFPIAFYNKYKSILSFLYDNIKVGCHVVYAEIVPKKFT